MLVNPGLNLRPVRAIPDEADPQAGYLSPCECKRSQCQALPFDRCKSSDDHNLGYEASFGLI